MIRRRIRSTLRLAGLILLTAAALWGIRALSVQFGIHLSNEWERHKPLPRAFIPGKGDRVLVFAPHSDDETLGCGGLLAVSKSRGARVHVALLTNGDGFKLAVGRNYGTFRVTPELCIRFAYSRQRETLKALKTLGLSARSVTFMGYPDRGIADLWDRCWGEDTLYVSHATAWDHSPYVNSFTRDAPYCGRSLLNDIERLIEQELPTDIYIPHPCDNHSDHYATYCFVIAAIHQLESAGLGPGSRIRIHTYLVHRGDWPTPKGDYPRESLGPPYALAHSDTRWSSLELPAGVAARKQQAISCYRTQTAIDRGFLMSFARRNEVFGTLPDRRIAVVARGRMQIDGRASDWSGIKPAVLDPVGDYVVADFSKGGDVRAVYLASDGRQLFIRFDCVRSISRRITYTIDLRGLNRRETDDRYSVTIRPGSVCLPKRTVWSRRNRTLEMAIPLSKLNFDRVIFVRIGAKTLRLTVDHTGWRGFEISRSSPRSPS